MYIELFNVLIVLIIFFSGALIFFLGAYTLYLFSIREVIKLEKPVKLTEDEKNTNKIKKEDEDDDKRISFF